MDILWLVICVAAIAVTGHPVEHTYSTPDLSAVRSEPAETPGHADDAFQFAYAVASPEHGTYHGHQASRDQEGQTSGSYYALGSDGHWRQTIYADNGKGFQALSNQRPAGSPPPQVSEVNYQIFVHPGATAISASGSRPPAEISFFGAKGPGRALPSLGLGRFFDSDSDEDDDSDGDDDDDDDSFSLESDYDNYDVDDDVFRQNFNFNFRHENDNEENENDETENDEDDNEDDSIFPNFPTPIATVSSFPSPTSTHVSPSAFVPGLAPLPASSSVRIPSSLSASPEQDEDASVLLSDGNISNENEFLQPAQPAIGTISHISPVSNTLGFTAPITGQTPAFIPAAAPVSLHNSVQANTPLRIPDIAPAPTPAPIDHPGFAHALTAAHLQNPGFASAQTPAPLHNQGFAPSPTPAHLQNPGFASAQTPAPLHNPGFAPAPTPAPFHISTSAAAPAPTPIRIPASAPTHTASNLLISASARTPSPLNIPAIDIATTPAPLHFPEFAPSVTDAFTPNRNVGVAFGTTPAPPSLFSPTPSSVDPSVLTLGNSVFVHTPSPVAATQAQFNFQSSDPLPTNDINSAPSPFANAFSVSTPPSIQQTFGSFTPLSGSIISSRQQSTSPVVNPTLSLGSPAVFPFAIVPTSALSVASSPVNTDSRQRTQTIQSPIQATLLSNNLQQSFNTPITGPLKIRDQSSFPLSHTSISETQLRNGLQSLQTLNRPESIPITGGLRVTGQNSRITQSANSAFTHSSVPSTKATKTEALAPATIQNGNPFPVNFQTQNQQINFSALRGTGIPLSFTRSQPSLGAPVQPSRTNPFLAINELNHSGETPNHSVNRSGVAEDSSAAGIPLF